MIILLTHDRFDAIKTASHRPDNVNNNARGIGNMAAMVTRWLQRHRPMRDPVSIQISVYSPVNLLKHNIYALFGRLKQYFTCFDCSIFLCAILLSCGIACPTIHAETGVTASARVLGRINK